MSSRRSSPASPSLPVRRHGLDAIFAPRSVALVGASERPGSVGRTIFENLLKADFGGPLYPVNPVKPRVLRRVTFPSVRDIPDQVDLAVIATPASTVPGVIADCVAAGVKGAVIISAGFRECGATGIAMEQEILTLARQGNLRIIGPNCLGVMLPHAGLNATFAAGMALPGKVAFISQSGALCTAVLDWSLKQKVGFSAFISIGSMADVSWSDLIDRLGDDPHTQSIVMYMESIGDARGFLSAAREVALTKPIILIKVGRTAQAAQAAASHTGSLTGSDEVLDAAFRRVGVLRVNTIEELFDMAEVLAKQPRPKGPRLAIVTNAGGPAALATDRLVLDGNQLATLSPASMAALDRMLPPHWSHGNPVDLLGDADAQRYAEALEIVTRDPQNDGVLVVLTPQAMTECTATAEAIKTAAAQAGKPLLASWMGGQEIASGMQVLAEAGIPAFGFPDAAARAFAAMWRYSHGLDALYETPALLTQAEPGTRSAARAARIIAAVRKAGRTLLTEVEAKALLSAYGIPTVSTRVARTEAEALVLAAALKGPAVLKLYSETITHKSDVGGVKLNLRTPTEVRQAWREIRRAVPVADFQGVTVQPMVRWDGFELILGSSMDAQFGPVLLFGAGGQLVEIFKDRALGLPPLNATLARRLIEQTRIFHALAGTRGKPPVDLHRLEQVLVAFSQLIAEQRSIKELDINPLLASGKELIALDARVVLQDPDLAPTAIPSLAIRPYPAQYVTHWKLRRGPEVTIRPIRPEDEPQMVEFHRSLSPESVHLRYFSMLDLDQRIAHERLRRICFNDYDREIALIVERRSGRSRAIIAVGRLSKLHGSSEAEFAIIVSDEWQGRGLGTRLMDLILRIAREEKLERIFAHILPSNTAMQTIARKCGLEVRVDGAGDWRAEIALG